MTDDMSSAVDIHASFQGLTTSVNALLDTAVRVPDAKTLQEVSDRISRQQRILNESASSLPAYDIRRYQTTLSSLSAKLATTQEVARPKAKFTFKSKRTDGTKAQVCSDPIPAQFHIPPILEAPGSLVINEANRLETKLVNAQTHPAIVSSSTLTVDSVKDSEIDLSKADAYTSVTLRALQNCTVNAGVSSSALFIENCTSCKIEGEAQQFRIHSCADCDIKFICRTGRPVIEDCQTMRFQNMQLLNGIRNETSVDDFSDLSRSRRNWSIIT